MKKVKLVIKGNVQDIGFRLRLLKEAQRLSISQFFADNQPDKRTVIAYVGGKDRAVDEYVKSVKGMKAGNPGVVEVRVERYRGEIRGIGDYVDYLHTEQLSKGVEAVQILGETLKEAARDFTEGVANGFRHMDKRFDELPEKVAAKLAKR